MFVLIFDREIFTMCQSSKDYQLSKDKLNLQILQKNIVAYFDMIAVLKTILTAKIHPLIKAEIVSGYQFFDCNNEAIQSSFQRLDKENTQNPYSHLLCFRLLKDSFVRVDYGFLTLMQAEMSSLIFNISSFDSLNPDQQRGRKLYLQDKDSPIHKNNTSTTQQELEIVGYSVHKIALETLMTLDAGVALLPYHVTNNKKQNLQYQNQPLTSRTVNQAFNDEFALQRMRSLAEQVKNYDQDLLESVFHRHFKKTKQINIKYPQKLHYFKQRQIERFKKLVYYNSEHKKYHILKFYQILIACLIMQQNKINQQILDSVQNSKCHHLKNLTKFSRNTKINGFQSILSNVIETGDRFSVYYAVTYLSKGLQILKGNQKENKLNYRARLTQFLSICQILNSLIAVLEPGSTKGSIARELELNHFNLQIYLAFEGVIIFYILEAYFQIFDGKKQTLSQASAYHYQYVRYYFYYLLLKIEKIRTFLLLFFQMSAKKQSLKNHFSAHINHQRSLAKTLIQKINNFLGQNLLKIGHFKKIIVPKDQQMHLNQLEQSKELFVIELKSIEDKKLSISNEVIKSIQRKLQFLQKCHIIEYLKKKNQIRSSKFLPKKNDLINISECQSQFSGQKFLENLQSNAELELEIQKQNIKKQKIESAFQLQSKQVLNSLNQQNALLPLKNDEIPKQFANRVKSIENYQLKTNSNNISKLNFNNKKTQKIFLTATNCIQTYKQPQRSNQFFKQTISKDPIQFNFVNADAETSRNLSKRENKLNYSNNSVIKTQSGCSNLDQTLSCPTYFNDDSTNNKNFEETIQPISKKLNRTQKQLSKVFIPSKQIQSLQKQSQKLKNIAKQQNQRIFQQVHSDLFAKDSLQKISFFQQQNHQPLSRAFQRAGLQSFNFSTKTNKELLKKKVLLIKDQLVQIGMITHFEINMKNLNQDSKSKNQLTQDDCKLKAKFYITPLIKLKKINLQILSPQWIDHEFLANKTKQNLKPDSQYISHVEFSFKTISKNKNLNQLPQLTVQIQFLQNQNQFQNNFKNKVHRFFLPIFLNKFFTEETPIEINSFNQILTKIKLQWIQVSSKLVKEPKDIDKYFSKVHDFKLSLESCWNYSLVKLRFMSGKAYVLFRFLSSLKKSLQLKQASKKFGFCMISQSQFEHYLLSNKKNYSKEVKQVQQLIMKTIFSLFKE